MSDHERSIIEQIEQDARFMRRARMLPQRALTPAEIEQVARDAKQFLKERRLSIGKLSRALGEGFSESVLSQFLSSVYKGDCERIARAVNAHIERVAQTAEVKRPDGFVETEVATRILTVIRTAVETCCIGEVIGPAGVGKTLTFETAVTLYPGSIYMRAIHGTRSPSGFIADLAGTLGVVRRANMATIQRLIIDALKGSGRPIFLDEAHQFREATFEVIRDVHDGAKVPIVLGGTRRLREMTTSRDRFFGQFNRRIVARCDVTDVATRPVNPRPLFTIEDVRRVFESAKVRLTDDAHAFLTDLANIPDEGALGLCEKVVMIAGRLAAFRDKAIDGAILLKVFRQMHGAAYATWTTERIKTSAARRAAVA